MFSVSDVISGLGGPLISIPHDGLMVRGANRGQIHRYFIPVIVLHQWCKNWLFSLHQSDESGIRLVPICVPNNESCSMLVIAFNVAKATIKILCDKCVCKIMEPKFNHLEWRF